MDNARLPEDLVAPPPQAGAFPSPISPSAWDEAARRQPSRSEGKPAAVPGFAFRPTAIAGAYEVEMIPFRDARGTFSRAFCADTFRAQGLMDRFVHANVSGNPAKGTLRGLHLQDHPRAEVKLVRATRGRVQDVAVDLRPASPTYLRWASVELSADRQNALYVPEGCAHGFLTLEDQCEVFYLVSDVYAPDLARTYRWDDPAFSIQWQIAPTLISDRDAAAQDYRP